MSDTLREDFQRRSEALYASAPQPNMLQARSVPEEVHVYHSLVPLEATDKERRKWFLGCSSIVYKATHRDDGTIVVLRRIEGELQAFSALWMIRTQAYILPRLPLDARVCI